MAALDALSPNFLRPIDDWACGLLNKTLFGTQVEKFESLVKSAFVWLINSIDPVS